MSDEDSGEASRRARGLATLERIHGATGLGYVAQLRASVPEFADMLVDFPFGDVYARPGLDLRTRQLATIAALTILGTAPRELTIHIRGALNVGATRQEVIEIIMQMSVYGGFPAALNALSVARAAFGETDSPA
jgi:4-carboxymuconolactone decarboxylase